MKLENYKDIESKKLDVKGVVKGITGRVAIGKKDGANNFCMRVFEVEPGGYAPKHVHDWEHEIFFHHGAGEVYSNGEWHAAPAGTTVFIPGNEEHQIRNAGDSVMTFVCLIPAGAPEI